MLVSKPMLDGISMVMRMSLRSGGKSWIEDGKAALSQRTRMELGVSNCKAVGVVVSGAKRRSAAPSPQLGVCRKGLKESAKMGSTMA